MAITGGFTGKTLRVDLTTRTATVENTLEKYGKFWGGTGMAYKVLWDEVPNTVDCFDPENRIIFGWGPLVGSGALCNGRTCFTALSPCHPQQAVATGHMGGHFSAEAKFAGWDGIIVQGKYVQASGSGEPSLCYIAIHDDKVEIVDAPHMRGNGLHRTTLEIMEAMGPQAQVAAIGQAGQNLVPMSVIMCSSSHSGGAGMGAVMGSKNCVGIGVVGTGTVKVAASKKAFRALVENAHQLVGGNNQAFLPNSPQPWAEYVANQRWYAAKGKFWGAANPPVETGICDPHDRQSVGYRCFKSDGGKNAEKATIRMNGCHSCPVRCHQMINVPTAAKWGLTNTYAQNTCTGWWGNGVMNTSRYQAAVATNQDTAMTTLESYVVGNYMTNDYGLWNNYGVTQATFKWLMGDNAYGTGSACSGGLAVNNDWGVTRIKPVVQGNTLKVYGTSVDEWTYLNNTSNNADSGMPGLITLYKNGDLRAMLEFGRLMSRQGPKDAAGKDGKFSFFMGASIPEFFEGWRPASVPDAETGWVPSRVTDPHVTPLVWVDELLSTEENFIESECSECWGVFEGGAWHHGDGHTGMLLNTGYNTHPQNHCFGPNFYGNMQGLPAPLRAPLARAQYAKRGITTGDMGKTLDYTTPFCREKAVAAMLAQVDKELCDSLGACSWMFPWYTSPLKERGYQGDVGLLSKFWNAVCGDNKTVAEFDNEGKRFYTLQRCLTMVRMNNYNMKTGVGAGLGAHDQPQQGRRHSLATMSGGTYEAMYANWDTAGGTLETYYDVWGYDIGTGAPTRATLTALGMPEVADKLHEIFPTAPASLGW